MLYFNLLDEYLIIYIYKLVWIMKMNDVIKELKLSIPCVVYHHGGCSWNINYNKLVKEFKSRKNI